MSKRHAYKVVEEPRVWADGKTWTVCQGKLKFIGRPSSEKRLFVAVGEKLPFDALKSVSRHLQMLDIPAIGVYVAHDSMGVARYIGRGNIFQRLLARRNAQILELVYFSFYVVQNKQHEREIETILIRAAGPMLQFNERKKRVTIEAGNVLDYEAGTLFYERHYKKGKRAAE